MTKPYRLKLCKGKEGTIATVIVTAKQISNEALVNVFMLACLHHKLRVVSRPLYSVQPPLIEGQMEQGEAAAYVEKIEG